jgi:hypothetical protein
MIAQSRDEVVGGRLFRPPAGSRTAGTGRVACLACGEDGVVAALQALDLGDRQCFEALRVSLAGKGIGLAQYSDHVARPSLARDGLGNGNQLA